MVPANSTNSTGPGLCPYPDVYYITLGVIGTLGFLFNFVLLFVLWRNKTPEFRSGTSYVIGNLALADCLSGIAVLLFVACDPLISRFQLPMIWTTIEASLMSLMLFSVERTLAFRYPFASKTIFTIERTIFVIILIWIFALTCGVLVHFYTQETQLAMTIIFELCVVIFLASQGYVIAKMQERKRRDVFCDRDVSKVTKQHICGNHKNNRVTKVVLVLIVIVVVTLLPYMISMQIYFLSELKIRPPLSPRTKKALGNFIYYFYPIELLNFVVNPIVYAYRLKRYRAAFFYAFSFLNCGPFVNARSRARTLSGASDVDHQNRKSQKLLVVKNDLKSVSSKISTRRTMVDMI